MQPFAFSTAPLEPERYRQSLSDPTAGGYASFEGWVRNHNEGRSVRHLEYEAFESLAVKEGARIVQEAIARYGVLSAACVHRVGDLAIGEMAVWVGVSSRHRAEAFAACRYIIDEVKHRVPIWKKEHYVDGDSGWVNCERCAQPGEASNAHGSAAEHDADPLHHHDHATHDHHHHPHPAPGGHAVATQTPYTADYSRQMALPQVGPEGQARLQSASVLVIGAGGLGVPVLQYLAAAGVGTLTIMDGDRIEASNLHRQPLYGAADVGQPKALVAAARLVALNPGLRIEAVAEHATRHNLQARIAACDLVVECTDNFAAKFLVNDAAVHNGRAAVFASVHQYEGQLQVYRARADWPCLRCLWPQAPQDGLVGNCAQAGVLGPVPAVLGAMQAMEALKLLLGIGPDAVPAVHVLDLMQLQWRVLRAQRRADCHHAEKSDQVNPPTMAEEDVMELDFATLGAARESGMMLIDIREGWERDEDEPGMRIDVHVPLSQLLDGRVGLPPAERYLIVCAHGVRSLALAEYLRRQGIRSAYSLRGGLANITA